MTVFHTGILERKAGKTEGQPTFFLFFSFSFFFLQIWIIGLRRKREKEIIIIIIIHVYSVVDHEVSVVRESEQELWPQP